MKTSFEDFTEFLKEDSRAETLDIGNIRLAYNGYMEKVSRLLLLVLLFLLLPLRFPSFCPRRNLFYNGCRRLHFSRRDNLD